MTVLCAGQEVKVDAKRTGLRMRLSVEIAARERGKRKVYYGETARNAFTRGKEHLKDLDRKSTNSVMWRHCREKHEGSIPDFRMNVKACYGKDAMLRQIADCRLPDCSVNWQCRGR